MGAGAGNGSAASSPADAVSTFVEVAAAEAHQSSDPDVSIAFALGWQMAELYLPDRRVRTRRPDDDDLPGVSRFTGPELQRLRLLQIQAGITKLKPAITRAGLQTPDVPHHLDHQEILDLHVELLSTLTAADFKLGKAYGLGRALADTTRCPPDYRAELGPCRVATLTGWIRELATALPPHTAHPVADSLEAWSHWSEDGDDPRTARKLAAQGRLYRSLLSGEKRATDVLETSDYIRAGEGMLQRAGALAKKFLKHYWWLTIGVIALFALGVALIATSDTGAAIGTGAATIFASLGLTWKGIGASLGRATARLEEPLWQAELDRVIYERITPNEIVTSQSRKRGPDEPSLAAAPQAPTAQHEDRTDDVPEPLHLRTGTAQP